MCAAGEAACGCAQIQAAGSRVDAAGPLAPAQGFFPTSTKLAVGGLSLAAATGCLRSARTLPGMEPAGGELGSSALGSPGPAPRMQPRPRPSNTAAAKTKPCLAQPSKLSLPAAVPADCGPVSYRIVSSRVWAARARRWDDAPPTAPAWTERGGGDKVWLFFSRPPFPFSPFPGSQPCWTSSPGRAHPNHEHPSGVVWFTSPSLSLACMKFHEHICIHSHVDEREHDNGRWHTSLKRREPRAGCRHGRGTCS